MIICLLLLSTGLAAKDSEQIWNFDGDKEGTLPSGFINEAGGMEDRCRSNRPLSSPGPGPTGQKFRRNP